MKNRIWHIRNYNRKKFEHEIKRRRIRKQNRGNIVPKEKKIEEKTKYFDIKYTPICFDLLQNTEECISFFNELNDSLIHSTVVKVNMRAILQIDISAIIFYISMLKNLRHRKLTYSLSGLLPTDENVLTYLRKTGFLKYFKSSVKSINSSDENIMIKEGNIVLGAIAGQVCSFIQEKLNKSQQDTKLLYKMIIELMDNTKSHAYKNSQYVNNWYLYAEIQNNGNNNFVRVCFFDNGAGIPTTVNKTKREKFEYWISNSIGLDINAATSILEAAFNGAFKTETLQQNRGKGLPLIKSLVEMEEIKNLKVISNRAYYSLDKKEDINDSLQGTLYYWEVY